MKGELTRVEQVRLVLTADELIVQNRLLLKALKLAIELLGSDDWTDWHLNEEFDKALQAIRKHNKSVHPNDLSDEWLS